MTNFEGVKWNKIYNSNREGKIWYEALCTICTSQISVLYGRTCYNSGPKQFAWYNKWYNASTNSRLWFIIMIFIVSTIFVCETKFTSIKLYWFCSSKTKYDTPSKPVRTSATCTYSHIVILSQYIADIWKRKHYILCVVMSGRCKSKHILV